MKLLLSSFLFAILLFSCKSDNKITFSEPIIEKNKCTNCPIVEINIPNALPTSKTARTINTALKEELILLLTFDDEKEVSSIETAIASFKNAFLELKEMHISEAIEWEAIINGEVIYENKYVLTIVLNSYIFTGGAHGYNSITYLNFNKDKGVEFENWELFKDKEGFTELVETKFRAQENMKEKTPINATGFMFEDNVFVLPENIGFTEEGMQLLYNPYEVSSYADGSIVINLSYIEIEKYLTIKIE